MSPHSLQNPKLFRLSPIFCRNIAVLPFLGPAADQDHQSLAVLAKINSVAGPEINLVFENALSHALGVGQVTPLHPREGHRHLGGGNGVQPLEPLSEAFFCRLRQRIREARTSK
jgi:hypothetical protein